MPDTEAMSASSIAANGLANPMGYGQPGSYWNACARSTPPSINDPTRSVRHSVPREEQHERLEKDHTVDIRFWGRRDLPADVCAPGSVGGNSFYHRASPRAGGKGVCRSE